MDDFANYKVADFKRELKARGLSTNGAKPELLLRLQTAIATEKSGLEDSSVMDDSLIDEDSMLEDEEDESGSDVDSSNENSTDSPVNLSSPVKTPEKKDPGTNIAPVTSPNVQKIATEKAQNGDQSGIPTKKKKITINRLPVQTPPQPVAGEVSLPPPETAPVADPIKVTPTDDVVAAKVVKLSVTTAAVDKLKSRQEKFGSISSVTSSAVTAAAPVAEKLKKRVDRFGSAGSAGSGGAIGKVSLTPEDQIKLAKRKERFGIQLAEEKNAEVSAAKEKRNARFAGAAATVSTPEIEERKLKRAARFATAT